MRTFTKNYRYTTLCLIVLIISFGCNAIQFTRTGEMQTKTQSVDLGAATSANVRIEMNLGELKIDGGNGKLMEGTFNYNVAEWQPQVSYSVNGSQGALLVTQPDRDNNVVNQNGQNRWDLHISNNVPIDLEISTGSGTSELNLSQIDLTNLKIETGAGEGTFDLSGGWSHDLPVTIRGGVGSVTVILPREMGVQVDVKTGIGSVKTDGFTRDGDRYVNEAFGDTPQAIYLEIQAGIGTIDLQVR